MTTGEMAVPVTLMASVVPKGPCMRPPLSITWYHVAATSSVHKHDTNENNNEVLSHPQASSKREGGVPLARNMGKAP